MTHCKILCIPVYWIKNNTSGCSDLLDKFKLLRGVNCIAQPFGLQGDKNLISCFYNQSTSILMLIIIVSKFTQIICACVHHGSVSVRHSSLNLQHTQHLKGLSLKNSVIGTKKLPKRLFVEAEKRRLQIYSLRLKQGTCHQK